MMMSLAYRLHNPRVTSYNHPKPGEAMSLLRPQDPADRTTGLDAPVCLAEVAEGVTHVNGGRVKPRQSTAGKRSPAA
jgi:hypothetical protein